MDKKKIKQKGKIKILLLIMALSCFIAPSLYADVIYLKNGNRVVGEIVEETDEAITVREAVGSYGFAEMDYKKADIERIEKTSATKKKRVKGTNIKEYRIVGEETTAHKAITGDLSSYSAQELEKLPLVKRKEYRVVVPEGLSKAEVKSVVKKIISDELEKDEDIDEMIIFLYDDERDIEGRYTIARAIWAVNGGFGNTTPQIAKSNDKSRHKTTLDIRTPERKRPTPTATSPTYKKEEPQDSDDTMRLIRREAEKKWAGDYKMQEYEISQQVKAYNEIVGINQSGGDVDKEILSKAFKKWYPDFKMILFEYKQQKKAYQRLY
jgi:hypothetical protein